MNDSKIYILDFAEQQRSKTSGVTQFRVVKEKITNKGFYTQSKLTCENEIKKSSYNHECREFISNSPAFKEGPQVERK